MALNKTQLIAAIAAIDTEADVEALNEETNDTLRELLTSITPEPTAPEGGQEIDDSKEYKVLSGALTTKAGIKVEGDVITEDMISGGAASFKALISRKLVG